MKLLVVIPALDEEASIRGVIRRTLEACGPIVARSPVTDVAVTVVSDGSKDRTVERAREFGDTVEIIVFPENRGYGAAIKEAWRRSDADLLGFLDADATCDPSFFGLLCERLVIEGGDIAVGCRMNDQSAMPLDRRIGNLFFAWLLSALSGRRVRDAASGMRVVRRSSLPALLPLPDGLHFTVAMTARAVLGGALKVCEVDIAYGERAGTSKLRVGRDGLRCLAAIMSETVARRPARLVIGCLALGNVALLLWAGGRDRRPSTAGGARPRLPPLRPEVRGRVRPTLGSASRPT